MFDIIRERANEVDIVRIENRQSGERISIAPEFGGNVCELTLAKGGQTFSVLDGYSARAEFTEHSGFKSVKLIPFPNRIQDGRYDFEGKTYQLPINREKENHALHGFFYNLPMEIETRSSDGHEAVVILSNMYGGNVPGYPFELKIQITYTLHGTNSFTCATEIENIGQKPAPVGDGWHPYFSLGGRVDEMLLKIPAEHRTEVDDRMIPTGKKLPVDGFETPTLIGNTLFDTGFSLPDSSDSDDIAVTELHYAEKDVVLEVWQEIGSGKYNYLQIYTPPSRTSIAVEPMTCNIDAFNNKEGLIVLNPGERFRASYGVKIR